MLRAILLVFAFSLSASPLLAADVTAVSHIGAVTVFPQSAEITRYAEFDLAAGTNMVLVRDLPAEIVQDSVRVEGEAAGGLEIGSVDTRRIFVKQPGLEGPLEESERKRIENEILKLKDERAGLDGTIEAASAQKTLAQNLAQLPVAGIKVPAAAAAGAQTETSPDWSSLFALIGGKMSEVNAAILEAKVKQRALDEQIKDLQARLERQPPEESERTEVAVAIEASAPLKARLSIRYQVPGARWAPIYDARLDTGTTGRQPSLAIARRAEISQETGEDWTDVELTLSTTRPGGATQAPALMPEKVDFKPEIRPLMAPAPSASRALTAPGAEAKKEERYRSGGGRARERDMVAVERAATMEASPFQAIFHVPGRSTVLSSVGERRLFIASETLKPTLKIVTVPKENAAAFLHAAFTHDSPAPYLPGKIALYRDGVFAGSSDLPLIPAGEERELGFGLDDAVKVNRVSVKRAKGETGIITSSNVDEQHYKITVTNLHDRSIPLLALDQMPYSEDEKIIVELLPLTSKPVDVNYDDKRGLVAWSMDLKPKEEREIAFSYQITWPAKREVIVRPGG